VPAIAVTIFFNSYSHIILLAGEDTVSCSTVLQG
jgi:hypothetical protein